MLIRVYSDYKQWVLIENLQKTVSAASLSRGDEFSIDKGVRCAVVRMVNRLDHSMLEGEHYVIPTEDAAAFFFIPKFYLFVARVLYRINWLLHFRYGKKSRRVCLSVEKTAAALWVENR